MYIYIYIAFVAISRVEPISIVTPLVTLIRSLTRIMITTDTVGSERIHLFDGGFFYGRKRVVLSLRPDFTGEFGPVEAIKCSPGSKKEGNKDGGSSHSLPSASILCEEQLTSPPNAHGKFKSRAPYRQL